MCAYLTVIIWFTAASNRRVAKKFDLIAQAVSGSARLHDLKQATAKIKQHGNCQQKPLMRDEALREIRRHGRQSWKKHQGYSMRNLAETMMCCFKTAFGDRLQNRLLETQSVEVGIKCNILNQFRQLGRPDSYAVN